ncbi:hypothetical protein [Xanthomonas sp. SI]|uniref:hypothetical protein n=1 Tax=Xanthomonas sp. SI TaxID=2724123 RepID=UPI00163B042E|nr:hypothetical protein [Xanthomonas sp. SI]QNH13778.1 hypothetical protein HEP75_03241 [Xanthomonas sp. SI]
MAVPRYPGTDIPVRRGDLVKWFDDESPSTVLFVVSTGDFPPQEDAASREWFRSEFGQGVMIDTPSAGRVLESEDCANLTLVRSVDGHA